MNILEGLVRVSEVNEMLRKGRFFERSNILNSSPTIPTLLQS